MIYLYCTQNLLITFTNCRISLMSMTTNDNLIRTCGSAHNTSVTILSTVVNSPSSVGTLRYQNLISYTIYVIQPYLARSISKCGITRC